MSEDKNMQRCNISIGRYLFPQIHSEGIKFVLIFAVIAALLSALHPLLGWIGTILTVFCFYFFRNPVRVTPKGDALIISPADGIVQMIRKVVPPMELELGEKPLTRISIFMSVFNVHVNRAPVSGKVVKTVYHGGAFVNASLDKASEKNERQSIVIEHQNGKSIGCVQIAGLIARRILCNLHYNTEVTAGEIYGLIRFGSRLDVYLPDGVMPKVICGQIAVAGETILADMKGTQEASKGEIKGFVAGEDKEGISEGEEFIDERELKKVSRDVVDAEVAKAAVKAEQAMKEDAENQEQA